MNNFEALEADLAASVAEVRTGMIKRVAEFDWHVERHHQTLDIFATGIVMGAQRDR